MNDLHYDAMAIAYDDENRWKPTSGYFANALAEQIEELVEQHLVTVRAQVTALQQERDEAVRKLQEQA